MPTIRIKLGEALELLGVTPNKFAVKSGIRSNTVYDLIKNNKKMITWNTLCSIIFTLNNIAKENSNPLRFTISDILEYIEDH